MKFFLSIFYSFIFWIIIRNHRFFKIEGIRNEALRAVFLLKLISGFLLLALYTYYYTDRSSSDVYKYFDDGTVMYNALFNNPLDYLKMVFGVMNDNVYFSQTYYNEMSHWYRAFESNIFSDSHAIIRFNALAMLFSFGQISVHVVFMVFLSFIGLTGLYKFFFRNAKRSKIGLFVAIYLLPSVVFWGSGMLKEGLIFFALGLLLYEVDKIARRFDFFSLFWIVFSLLLLIHTKIYIILILAPLLLAHLYSTMVLKNRIKYLYFVIISMFFLFGFFVFYNLAGLNMFAMIVQKQNDFMNLALQESAGSLLHHRYLALSFTSFITELPMAVFNVFFRPLPILDNSLIYLPNIMENTVLLILAILAFFYRTRLNRSELSLLHFCFYFVVCIFVLTGFTVPVLGAIVRYKTVALPFMFAFLAILMDRRLVLERFPFLKKHYELWSHKISYKTIYRKN
ncbi:MAG: hypothetical protein RBS19_09305 [Bacteroidales bacterium]|nr:hypothetical protein [Bacteroidales bacterium]